jgi:hypothetical protein
MNKSFIAVLSLSLIAHSTYVLSEVKSNDYLSVNQNPEVSEDIIDLHQALSDYSKLDQKNNAIYEQKRREMLDSVEQRFYACDTDSDDTLDVFETTQCLPQVARQFRKVDVDNDNVITLDEISMLAKEYEYKHHDNNKSIAKSGKEESSASLETKSKIKSIKTKQAL